MAGTTYDILTQKVADLQFEYDKVSNELTALKTDANFLQTRSQLDSLYANRNFSKDADQTYLKADALVRTQHENIRNRENQLADIKIKLDQAVKAVSDYERQSPTVKSEIAQKLTASSSKLLIVIAIVLAVATISTIVIIKIRNKNKTKTT